jgi:thymidylate synthase (FAD)
MERVSVQALDAILGQPFSLLDDGFIRVLDYMGSDASIVQAARVSYGAGTKHVSDDRNLIRFLMRKRHTSPFEMCELKIHVRIPMYLWRDWIRHRTANVNEYSTRYSEAIDSMHLLSSDQWRLQSATNKQGSAGVLNALDGLCFTTEQKNVQDSVRAMYEERLKAGIAREVAMMDLPLSTYTEAYWKIDLHNLLHFTSLRYHTATRLELQQYAQKIAEVIQLWVPHTWEAFEDYRRQALTLTRLDIAVLKQIMQGDEHGAIEEAASFGWITPEGVAEKANRERKEFEEKLQLLGIQTPWAEVL